MIKKNEFFSLILACFQIVFNQMQVKNAGYMNTVMLYFAHINFLGSKKCNK